VAQVTFALDVYPADDPAGKISGTGEAARLVRLTPSQDLQIEYTRVGHGWLERQFVLRIHGDHPDATAVNLARRNYVVFIRTDTTPDRPIGGAFMEEGDFMALSADEGGGRILEFRGPGSIFILDRYKLGHAVFADGQTFRGDFNVAGQWTWSGEPWGAMLLRGIEEGRDHPAGFFGAVTEDFTRTRDSNDNLWTELEDYETPIRTNVLALYADFVRQGLVAQCSWDIVVSAYRDIEEFRTDRTSGSFATNKARFEAGINIINEQPRRIAMSQQRTHILIEDRIGDYQTVDEDLDGNPIDGVPYMDEMKSETTADDAAIVRIGKMRLTRGDRRTDQALVQHIISDAPAAAATLGRYCPGPGGDYDVLDLVTIHTGDGEHDFDEQAIEVAAIRYFHDEAGNWYAEASLGATYINPTLQRFTDSIQSTIRTVRGVQLCKPTIIVEAGISFVGKTGIETATGNLPAATLDAIPGIQIGDLIIAHVTTDSDSTIPSADTGWTAIGNGGAGAAVASRGFWHIYDGMESGTYDFQVGNSILLQAYRGVDAADPIGDIDGTGAASSTISYPALTLEVTDGSSWVIAFAHSSGASDVSSDTVTGLTNRVGSRGGEHGGRDTNGGVASWTLNTQSVSTGNEWQSSVYELRAGDTGTIIEGDGREELVGSSVKAKRCDDTEHYHTDADPTVDDDGLHGFRLRTLWINETTGAMFLLIDDATGAADWLSVGGGSGAPTDATYLVASSHAGLSAEIPVGATPGGELGGTWASPTVDGTHAGSTHSASTDAHIADTSDAHDASAISVLDTGGNFTATDVEGVLAELDAAIAAGGIPATIFDAKGDLIAASAADTAARLAAGSDGQRLKAASGEATGLLWTDEFYDINFVIDGGGSVITTGAKGFVRVSIPGTIVAATIMGLPSGSIVVDIWKDTFANFPPVDADSITSATPPTLSSDEEAEDTTLSGWTTGISAGDILRFNVDSASTVTICTVHLKVKKS
jgi:hypothetical protein